MSNIWHAFNFFRSAIYNMQAVQKRKPKDCLDAWGNLEMPYLNDIWPHVTLPQMIFPLQQHNNWLGESNLLLLALRQGCPHNWECEHPEVMRQAGFSMRCLSQWPDHILHPQLSCTKPGLCCLAVVPLRQSYLGKSSARSRTSA